MLIILHCLIYIQLNQTCRERALICSIIMLIISEIPGYLHHVLGNIQVETFQIILSVLNNIVNVASIICLARMMSPKEQEKSKQDKDDLSLILDRLQEGILIVNE